MTRKKLKMLSDKIAKLESKEEDFTVADFIETLDLTMQRQALEHPELKTLYKKLTPEFEALVRTVQEMYETPLEETEQALFRQLLKSGTKALLPALEFLLHLKKTRATGLL